MGQPSPGKAGGFRNVSRSKRRKGTLTRPRFIGLPIGSHSGPQIQLIRSLIFLLLVLDPISDRFFVPTYSRDEISTRPKVLHIHAAKSAAL